MRNVGEPELRLLAHRLYHPDFFHVEDLVAAHEQIGRAIIVLLVGIIVTAICYALAPMVGLVAGVVFYAGFIGTGLSAATLSAKALEVPAWIFATLHIVGSAIPPFTIITMWCVRTWVRRGLADYNLHPGFMHVDRDEVRAAQKLMIGKQFVGYDLIG